MEIGGVDIYFNGNESILREIMHKIEQIWPNRIYEDINSNRDVDLDHVLSRENIEFLGGSWRQDVRDFFLYKNEKTFQEWNTIPDGDETITENEFLNIIFDYAKNQITFVMDRRSGEIWDIIKNY